ncbi:MAG: hypothetical protein HRU35_03565 [Rickettsiaceae bacterium]|nr:hypothetical protein [Rickettsiaceae bacterium]
MLWAWDDLAFWSIFSKELFINDAVFLTKEPLHILNSHYHYRRGPAYFHYFVMYFSGISEAGLLTTHFALHLLFAMPFFAARYFWQGTTLFMLLFILIMLLPGGNSTALISVYNDSTIGFIIAAALAIFISTEDKYKALKLITPIFFMMPIFREIGMWLGMYAAVILFTLLFYQKNNIEKLLHKFLFFLLLFSLPIISSHLWFWYVDVYGLLGRDPHQLNDVIGIFNDVINSDVKTWQIINLYFERFAESLLTKPFLFIYSLIVITLYLIIKTNIKYLKEFIALLAITSICLLLFLSFRLYIYILMAESTYSSFDGSVIDLESMLRFASSYLLLYPAICCIYIKQALGFIKIKRPNLLELILFILIVAAFGRYTYNNSRLVILVPICLILLFLFSKHSKRALIEAFIVVCSIGFIITNVKVTLDRLPKTFNIAQKDKIFREQTKLVTKLLQQQHYIEYDFINKNDKITSIRNCYFLVFFLYPHYTDEDRKKCFASIELDNNIMLPFDINTTKSNVDINEILENPDSYKCQVKYYPQHNYLNINCQ